MEKEKDMLRRRTFAGVTVLAMTLCVGGLFAVEGEYSSPRYGEYSFDNSISNEFWCTWGWVAPSPAVSASASVATFDFTGTTAEFSSVVPKFYRERRKGMTITFR